MNNGQKKHKRNRNKKNKAASIEQNVEPKSIQPPSDHELNTIVSSIENKISINQSKIYEVNNKIEKLRTSICNAKEDSNTDKPIISPIDDDIPLYEYSTPFLINPTNVITKIKDLLKSVDITPETSEIRKLIGELDLYIISLQDEEKEKEMKFNDEINGLKEEISSLSSLLKSENPTFSIDVLINPSLSYNSYEINQFIISQNSNRNSTISFSSNSTYSSDSDDESSEGYNSDELLNEIQKYMPKNLNLRDILPPKNIDELVEIESNYAFRMLQFDTIDIEVYSEEESEEEEEEETGKNNKNEEFELCYLNRINIIYNKDLNQSHRQTPISSSKSKRYIQHYNSSNKKSPTNQIAANKSNDKKHYNTPYDNSYISPSHLSSLILNDKMNNSDNNENNDENNQKNYQISPSNYNLVDEINGLEYLFNNSISIISERDITQELIEKNELAEYKDRELKLQAERLGNKVYDSESDNLSVASESSSSIFLSATSPLPQFDDEVILSSEKLKKQINEKMNEMNNTPFKVIKEEIYPCQSRSRFRQPNFNKEFEDEKCRINHFLTYNNDVVVINYPKEKTTQAQSSFINKSENENENSIINYPIMSIMNDVIENNEKCFENDIQMIIIDPILLQTIFYNDCEYVYNIEDTYVCFSEEFFMNINDKMKYIDNSLIDILSSNETKEKETETEEEEIKEEVKPPVEDENVKKIKKLEKQINMLKKIVSTNLKKSKYGRLIKYYHSVYSLEYQINEHILSLSYVESISIKSYYIEKDVEEEGGGSDNSNQLDNEKEVEGNNEIKEEDDDDKSKKDKGIENLDEIEKQKEIKDDKRKKDEEVEEE